MARKYGWHIIHRFAGNPTWQELNDLIDACSAELASRNAAKAEETLLFDQDYLILSALIILTILTAVIAFGIHCHSCIHCLEQTDFINTSDHKAGFIDCFGPLC